MVIPPLRSTLQLIEAEFPNGAAQSNAFSGGNVPSSRLISPAWPKAIYARNIRVAPVTSRQSFQNRYPHQFSAQQQTEEPHSNLKSVDKHSGRCGAMSRTVDENSA